MNIDAIYEDNKYHKKVKIIEIITTPNSLSGSCKAVVIDTYTGNIFTAPLNSLRVVDSHLVTKES